LRSSEPLHIDLSRGFLTPVDSAALREYLDPELVLHYARRFKVRSLSLANPPEGWPEGLWGYATGLEELAVWLNPNLDRQEVARRLSDRLGMEIAPEDVYSVLFLHEVGHSHLAGNVCLVRARVEAVMGGRRGELREIYRQAEVRANRFAADEWIAWKRGQPSAHR
jgi:hypothetical protein